MTPRDMAADLMKSPTARGMVLGASLALPLAGYAKLNADVRELQSQMIERAPVLVNLQLGQRDMARVLMILCRAQIESHDLPPTTDCGIDIPRLVIPSGARPQETKP